MANKMETAKANDIKARLEAYGRKMEGADILALSGKGLDEFVRIWMELYRECYCLRGLECWRKGKAEKVDMADVKEALFREAVNRWNKRPGAGKVELEALRVGDLLDGLKPATLPCPVEEKEAFKEALRRHFAGKQQASEATARQREEQMRAELDRVEAGMAYYKPMDVQALFRAWRKEAAGRVACEAIPWDYDRTSVPLGGQVELVYTPRFMPWQQAGGKPHFAIPEGEGAVPVVQRLALSMLLSLPVGALRLTFIDLKFSAALTRFRHSLHQAFQGSLVQTAEELSAWVRERTQYFCDTFAACGDTLDHNKAQGRIVHGYELCVVNGLDDGLPDVSCLSALARLVNEGSKAGIYFVLMGGVPKKWDSRLFRPLDGKMASAYRQSPVAIWRDEGYGQLLDLLGGSVAEHERLEEEARGQRLEARRQEAFGQPFQDAARDFCVEVGTMLDGGGRACFRLDEENHPHAFVIGASGSGKSVFLHTVLHQSMLKYSPQSLQFYLMDFKIGGVELNRYRNYPHVRTLLVDQGDLKVTLEILRDLYALMQERGKAMREQGCTRLKDYNARCPGHPFPRIVLLVDECQELFKEGRSKMQDEINDIVTQVAKQGRSQGVHIIFATQTLAGCVIPRDIPAQISDPYLLRCEMADAQRFINRPERVMEALVPHSLVHVNRQEQRVEKILPDCLESVMDDYQEAITAKHGGAPLDFEPFYFSGVQKYDLADGLREVRYRRHPEVLLGRGLKVRPGNDSFRLLSEMSQNLLVLGENKQGQGLRVLLVALLSLMHYDRVKNTGARFVLFLNGDLSDMPELEDYIYDLEDWGLEVCDNQRQRMAGLERLCRDMRQENECPTFVFVVGQDYYPELRMNVEVNVDAQGGAAAAPSGREQEEANLFYNGNLSFARENKAAKATTVADAWRDLLRNGPTHRIFTVWQLQRLANFMFKPGGVLAGEVESLFLYMACLHTKEDVAVRLNLEGGVDLRGLNADPEGLQIYLYNAGDSEGSTMTVYALPSKEEISKMIAKEQ